VNKILTMVVIAAGWFMVPHLAEAATLYVSPSSGSFSVGATFSVSVRTDTQGQAVNSAQVNVTYSSDTLELVSVKAGSSFPMQTPGSPSKTPSGAYFSGGIPSPGYTGNSGSVGVLSFRAKAVGAASISIGSGKVLLNDGKGTNSLSGTSGASFTITPPPVGGPTVTSASHPNPEAWYKNTTLEVTWNRPSGAHGFSFELDKNPGTNPDSILDTTITTAKSYAGLEDGTYYFHIKARPQTGNFGAVSHFRIQIDTKEPDSLVASLVGETRLDDVTRTPTVEFKGEDAGSGIARYDIYLDGQLVKEGASSPFTFDKLPSGPKIVRVVAYDKAGNERKFELPLIVTGPGTVTREVNGLFNRNIQVPLTAILIMNAVVIVLLVLFVALFLYFHRRKKQSVDLSPIAAIQAHVDASLEDLKLHINQELASLSRATSAEAEERQQKILSQINNNIINTKKKVDKEISQLKKKI
jgi:hypothetical protein